MAGIPETRYVKNAGGFLACLPDGRRRSDRPRFLRCSRAEKSSGREVIWDEPSYAHILWGLASRRRLNRLGTVDWVPQIPPPLDALRTPEE
jgi:hypothetical protein